MYRRSAQLRRILTAGTIVGLLATCPTPPAVAAASRVGHLTVNAVSLNGAGTKARLKPGAGFTVRMDFRSDSSAWCPKCQNQIVVGFAKRIDGRWGKGPRRQMRLLEGRPAHGKGVPLPHDRTQGTRPLQADPDGPAGLQLHPGHEVAGQTLGDRVDYGAVNSADRSTSTPPPPRRFRKPQGSRCCRPRKPMCCGYARSRQRSFVSDPLQTKRALY